MPLQEVQLVAKDTQKLILKTICEFPSAGLEELIHILTSRGKKVSRDEVIQVLQGISPDTNWHRASQEDMKKEILKYTWTLENQILFILPTKQKETTMAEFNQLRLQKNQPKVTKDLVRHVQSLLSVDGKNLARFRKFIKELSPQSDTEYTVQVLWLLRLSLANLNADLVSSVDELPELLVEQLKEKAPLVFDNTGKTSQRLAEKFVEKYFSTNLTTESLKKVISEFQSTYREYESGDQPELTQQGESDYNKLVQEMIEKMEEVQDVVTKSHEGGFLGKLFSGSLKNREGIIRKVDGVKSLINKLQDFSGKTNKVANEKVLLVQKLQSDYENLLVVKSQLENDLYTLNESFKSLEEKSSSMQKELKEKNESLEKAQERINSLQSRVDQIPELESKVNMLRDEFSVAKEISVRLYSRVNKMKSDLLKQGSDKNGAKVENVVRNDGEVVKHSFLNGNQTAEKVNLDS